jgi:hypothetical protein
VYRIQNSIHFMHYNTNKVDTRTNNVVIRMYTSPNVDTKEDRLDGEACPITLLCIYDIAEDSGEEGVEIRMYI